MQRVSILLLLVLSSCLVSAQDKPSKTKPSPARNYQGLLWEISGNGLDKPSYLYGTMHVSKKVAFHLSDTFFIALKNVEKVALESDPSTWMEHLDKLSELGVLLGGPTAGRNFKGFYENAFEIHPPKNKTLGKMLSKDHRQLNGMLHRFSYKGENFEEQTYLDLFIYQAGKRADKEVIALENYKETMRLLSKAVEPDEKEKPRKSSWDLFKDGRSSTEIMEDAYRKGDLDLIDSITVLTSQSDNFHKYFIVERNKIMANGMDSIMKTSTLFTGVGAAHLPGKEGVISLMRERGYTLRAINPKAGRLSTKLKKKIESTDVALEMSLRYPLDSAFGVDMPGKLFESPGRMGTTEYFFPEMMNGAFFSISRISTYAAFSGQSIEDIRSRLDSLLFENIPGDIEDKSMIDKDGYLGIYLVNKTRRGDYQRYQILVTPLEILIFKAGGPMKYALGGDINRFFNSVDYKIPASGRSTYSPAGGQISANMHNYRKGLTKKSFSRVDYEFIHTQAYDPVSGAYELLVGASLNDFLYIEEDTFELEQIVEELAEELDMEVSEQKLGKHMGYPAIWATMGKEDKKVESMVVIRGSKYYLALSIGEDPAPFFNSIKFLDAKYKEDFEEYTDTLMLFTVNTVPQPTDDELTSMISRYASRSSRRSSEEEEDNSHLSQHYDKVFRCNETSEEILVDYQTYHKYYGRTDSAFWSYREKKLVANDDDLYIKTQTENRDDSLIVREYLICDSTSTRAIKAKQVLKGGLLLTIRTSIDTLSEPSAFVTEFFESIRHVDDTIIDHDVFQSKALSLMNDLRSDDSLTKKLAKRSVGEVTIDFYEDRSALIDFINTYTFEGKDILLKSALITELGELEDDALAIVLEKMYSSPNIKTSVELACIESLSGRHDKKSYASLLRIIKKGDLPIPNYESDLFSFFYNLNDSIELSRILFPALYDFISYPEYKDNIFELLAELVHEGLVDKSIYGHQKKRIIREAQNELRRQLAGEESLEEIIFEPSYDDEYEVYEYMYDDYGSSSISDAISGFSKLMLPLYDEPAAKTYFKDLMTTKQGMLLLSTSALLLEKGKPVNDTLWPYFCKNEESRMETYRLLKELDRLDLFDSTYLNQDMFVRSQLFGSNAEEKDTIEFITKREVEYQGESGYVYFYKRKPNGEDYWRFEYIGLQPLDSTQVEDTNTISRESKKMDLDADIEELIEEAVRALNLADRRRVSLYSHRSFSYSDYLDY